MLTIQIPKISSQLDRLRKKRKSLISFLLFTFLTSQLFCGNKEDSEDIGDVLRNIPGVSNVQELSPGFDYRFFVFTLSQPVDHFGSDGSTFQQTLTLLYRSKTAPMVLATTGYDIPTTYSYQGEPTRLLLANQLTMEHRFFGESMPNPLDWSKLSIEQAAADEHQVVTTFKPIFSGKWLNTGGSKGGMTALFHRRFYPNDVDATLAYVAPISFSVSDTRYIDFIDSHSSQQTRLAIEAWQEAVLKKRNELIDFIRKKSSSASPPDTFNRIDLDKFFEFAVLEAPFTLWQYGDANLAAQVPAATASIQELYDYLDTIYLGMLTYDWSDKGLYEDQAYYQQSATQLGGPAYKESHLTGLLKYPGDDLPANYPPMGVSKSYDGGMAMRDIQNWLNHSAQKVIFIYGENDPWSAGAPEVTATAQSRYVRKYIVPAGNHSSDLASLTIANRSEVYDLLSQWMSFPIQKETPIIGIQAAVPKQQGILMDNFVMRRLRR